MKLKHAVRDEDKMKQIARITRKMQQLADALGEHVRVLWLAREEEGVCGCAVEEQ